METKTDNPRQLATLLFRALCIYLFLYFVFISDFASNYPVIWRADQALKKISNGLGSVSHKIFFRTNSKEWRFFDSYWTYSKLSFFLAIALIAATIWTSLDKAKKSRKLFIYAYGLSRYYLATAIALYSMWKLFETQFYLEPKNFLLPFYHNGPRALFWTFMASSRSYGIFGGIVEMTAVLFLLIRKTATLGALIAFATLANILVMDAAYDTPIKVIVFHLMVFNYIVLWPDTVRIFRFFVLKESVNLSTVPAMIPNEKYRKAGYAGKFALIGLIALPMIKSNLADHRKLYHPSYKQVSGIHEIDSIGYTRYRSTLNPGSWKKFTIEQGNVSHVLLPGDSVLELAMDADTLTRSIRLRTTDSSVKVNLSYRKLDSAAWEFEGFSGKDSIRLFTRQIDIYQYPLLKDEGRIIWSWLTPP